MSASAQRDTGAICRIRGVEPVLQQEVRGSLETRVRMPFCQNGRNLGTPRNVLNNGSRDTRWLKLKDKSNSSNFVQSSSIES
eukprot:CAMPEP_0113711590 /NCGR_PEP_ID=MMETSP0038_2-20120614/30855_1 /TAXON_ID=2898 /ORGANISM="Cryptomonas paramecium" /LENGTH=81 /DNA_ID=CAMNT_0000637891 /DNA_START=481 /DNA_END=723 /DNA_ORIENTATION=- /assembly_acc=CAM_ASM_000170